MNDDQRDYLAGALDAGAKLSLLWAVARPLVDDVEAGGWTIAIGSAIGLGLWGVGLYVLAGKSERDE